jgi:hypothetical protein
VSADVFDVPCPRCGAEAQKLCHKPDGTEREPHVARGRALDAALADFMRSTFSAREFPEVIWLGDEAIVGPFCRHCGNPFSLHGIGSHCPNRVLHPVFPPPSCTCHGERTPETLRGVRA